MPINVAFAATSNDTIALHISVPQTETQLNNQLSLPRDCDLFANIHLTIVEGVCAASL
jgi:hypothetical protein